MKDREDTGQGLQAGAVPPKPRKAYVLTKTRESWSEEEHGRFVEALRLYARDWKRIEEHVGTKSATQIRSHAQKHFHKAVQQGEEIPPPRAKRRSAAPTPRLRPLPQQQQQQQQGTHAPQRQPSHRQQQQQQQQQRQQGAPGFKVVMPSGGLPLKKEDASPAQAGQQGKAEKEDGSGEDDDDDGASGWETASDNEEDDVVGPLPHGQPAPPEGSEAAEDWEEWDVKRSLFDNHVSKSFEANLEYMWKNFGFYLPDAQYLKDPEGLIKYLGAKIQYGRVPIYTRGDDSNAKQFRSLHAVQRHMVDSGRCKMAYEDNEDEYSDFYEYEGEDESSQGEAAASTSRELIASGNKDVPAAELVSGGYELYLPSSSGQGHGGGKIIGSRDLARYYRQNPRPVDERRSVQVNTMLAKYRSLGIALKDEARSMEAKKAKSKSNKTFKYEARHVQGIYMRSNVIKNLPSCVPY